MKRPLLTFLVLLALIWAISIWIPSKSDPSTKREAGNARILMEAPHSKPAASPAASAPPTHQLSLPQVTMTAVDYNIDHPALTRARENPPFKLIGGAGTGRVVDRHGHVILESSEEIGIFGVAVSPDKKMVLVHAANRSGGNSLVLEPATSRRINLPSRPPGENLFSLSWHWIGPNLLFGTSGVEKVFHEGAHENCCDGNNVAQTRFYVFDLVTGQLSTVVMPGAVKQQVLNAVDVMSDGHIRLQHDEPQEGVEQDLGWFRINPSK